MLQVFLGLISHRSSGCSLRLVTGTVLQVRGPSLTSQWSAHSLTGSLSQSEPSTEARLRGMPGLLLLSAQLELLLDLRTSY